MTESTTDFMRARAATTDHRDDSAPKISPRRAALSRRQPVAARPMNHKGVRRIPCSPEQPNDPRMLHPPMKDRDMIEAYLRNIHCHEETDEVGADEPYVLVTAVNLASSVNIAGFPVPLPDFDVVRYGFDDVDEGET